MLTERAFEAMVQLERNRALEDLLSLPYEIQIALVAGYLGYKVTSIGKNRPHRTEDFLLQVLSFGLLSRAVVAAITWKFPFPDSIPSSGVIALVAAATSLVGVILGTLWRSNGEDVVRRIMGGLGVYRDDHEASVWQSIMNTKATWTVLHIYLEDGTVLEANFGLMNPYPKVPVVVNEDGIGVYLTGRYNAEGEAVNWDITGNQDDVTFTFIPKDAIKRLDVNWQLPASGFIASAPPMELPIHLSEDVSTEAETRG